MISDNEFLMIVQGLLEKTTKERVAWQEEKKPRSFTLRGKEMPAGTAFQLRLPESVIDLQHVRPSAEPDYIIFTLLRGRDGEPVAQRQVYEGDLGWDQLFDLFALVSRQLRGWDSVLRDVKSFLGKSSVQPVS